MKRAILLVCVAALAGPALAQRFQMQMRGGDTMAFLLNRDDVRKELQITTEQSVKLRDLRDKFDDERESLMENMRFNGGDGNGGGGRVQMGPDSEMGKAFAEMRERYNKEMKSILTEAQQKRLKELSLQRTGTRALMDSEVQTELGLTDEQKAKINELSTKMGDATRTIFEKVQNGELDRSEIRGLIDKNNEIMDAELDKVLTAAQKEKFKAMQGKPFTFDESEDRRGARGGPPAA